MQSNKKLIFLVSFVVLLALGCLGFFVKYTVPFHKDLKGAAEIKFTKHVMFMREYAMALACKEPQEDIRRMMIMQNMQDIQELLLPEAKYGKQIAEKAQKLFKEYALASLDLVKASHAKDANESTFDELIAKVEITTQNLQVFLQEVNPYFKHNLFGWPQNSGQTLLYIAKTIARFNPSRIKQDLTYVEFSIPGILVSLATMVGRTLAKGYIKQHARFIPDWSLYTLQPAKKLLQNYDK